MKYMAAVLLLVAAMSAQNAPSTSKADDNTGIEGLPKGAVAGPPLKGQHPGHLDIPAISREANGSLVSIIMFAGNGDVIAKGSGFFVSEDGRVVTNYHVIETGSYAFVEFPNGGLPWSRYRKGACICARIATWLSSRQTGRTCGGHPTTITARVPSRRMGFTFDRYLSEILIGSKLGRRLWR